MSVGFVAASSQYVTAPTTIRTYPITLGCWVYPTAASETSEPFGIGDITADTQLFDIARSSGNWIVRQSSVNGQGATATLGALVVNTWQFILARSLSATNYRMYCLFEGGAITQQAAADPQTSHPMTTLSALRVGARPRLSVTVYFSGYVGECWAADVDVDNLSSPTSPFNMQTSLIRQLAYHGPFSVPWIADHVIHYKRFSGLIDGMVVGEQYDRGAPVKWTATNNPTIAPDPPFLSPIRPPPSPRLSRFMMA